MRDPYVILGVRRNAGQDEIKAAWRSLAKAVHPDHNQDDPTAAERFAEAGKAYELLRDPKLRSRYDYARREAELVRRQIVRRLQEFARELGADDGLDATARPTLRELVLATIEVLDRDGRGWRGE